MGIGHGTGGRRRSAHRAGRSGAARGFRAPEKLAAFWHRPRARRMRRQGDPERLGLGHIAEAVQGSGHPACHSGFDGTGLDSAFDQHSATRGPARDRGHGAARPAGAGSGRREARSRGLPCPRSGRRQAHSSAHRAPGRGPEDRTRGRAAGRFAGSSSARAIRPRVGTRCCSIRSPVRQAASVPSASTSSSPAATRKTWPRIQPARPQPPRVIDGDDCPSPCARPR